MIDAGRRYNRLRGAQRVFRPDLLAAQLLIASTTEDTEIVSLTSPLSESRARKIALLRILALLRPRAVALF